jgi:hypothetical protein
MADVHVALWVRLDAKPGKEKDVADEAGRQAHLAGRVAAALMTKASELLAKPPAIKKNRRAGSQASGLT